MKKVSTAASLQSRNFSQNKLTIGLGLGNRAACLHFSTSGYTASDMPTDRYPYRHERRPSERLPTN
jgi:hypothetical protein